MVHADDGRRERCRSRVFVYVQAEDGIRYLVRSRGLGDVYKRQVIRLYREQDDVAFVHFGGVGDKAGVADVQATLGSVSYTHLTLPTSGLA